MAIVQRLGKFARVAGPGLNWKTPYLETVVQRMSMKVQQFDVQVETKTQDNVFVQIPVSIQYKVMPDAVESAFYKLSDPVKQIESMVYNVVLGHVPKMKLDDTFLNQADIATDLRDNLDASMKEYGYSIVKVLISDIVPDQKVKAAMNDINAGSSANGRPRSPAPKRTRYAFGRSRRKQRRSPSGCKGKALRIREKRSSPASRIPWRTSRKPWRVRRRKT